MICVFIEIILSAPNRPVRLEVAGSYASLKKKQKLSTSHNLKNWTLGQRHGLLNWLHSQSDSQSVRSMKSQSGGVSDYWMRCFHRCAEVLDTPALYGRDSEKMVHLIVCQSFR